MNKLACITAIFALIIAFSDDISYGQMQTYCTNIAGNIACTNYDHGTSSQSYCTSIGNNLTCTTYSDDYNKVKILQNYETGQVIGTALGTAIMSAIEQYRMHKRIRNERDAEWNQFVQDTLAKTELDCELNAAKEETTVVGCRTMIFTFNEFLQRHQKDFVPDGWNVNLLADALDKTAPSDQSTWTEQTYENAFQTLNKKQLDRKVRLGLGKDRPTW